MMPGHEKRVLSLDGLRGLGALMVFLLHVDIMVKPFGAGGPSLFPGSALVMVFFILSGIVLSLVPFKHMGNGGYDWLGYYPRRVVRLCVPLFAAIALALPVGYVAWRLGSTSRSALAVAYDAGLPTAVHDILMQFDVLFTDDLYTRISRNAIETADRLKEGLAAKGYRFYMESPTNQVFPILANSQLEALEGKAKFGFWEKYDDTHTVMRIATSWATRMEEIEQLIALM
mgnify:CR=1 FL=1